MPITSAINTDISELVTLINSAYRGEASKAGWTTEADLLEGEERINESGLIELLKNPNAVILKYESENREMAGCVYLDQQGEELYLGMLTVNPLLQASGIGRQLMSAAEDYAKSKHCSRIFMNVISIRKELIAWYKRQGYYDSGKIKPFPTDNKFGIPTQPLEFIILQKDM